MDIVASSPQIRVGNSAGTGGKVLFGNDSHGIARNPNISTFTDVNDVVMFTAGSGSVARERWSVSSPTQR
jgi:hypothetical protein